MTSLNIFARPINYNEGSYKDDLLQSMKPGKYNLDANYANRKIPRRVEDIGFLGKNGGRAKKLCDLPIIVSSNITAHIQEAHIFLGHFILSQVEAKIVKNKNFSLNMSS